MTQTTRTDDPVLALLLLLLRNLRLLLLVTVLGTLLSVAVSFLLPRGYRAEARIIPSHQLRGSGAPTPPGAFGGRVLQESFGIGRASRDVSALFDEILRQRRFVTDLLATGFDLPDREGVTLAGYFGAGPGAGAREVETLVTRVLRRHLRVRSADDAHVTIVSFELDDPEFAAVIVDTMVTRLDRVYSRLIGDQNARLADFMTARLQEAEHELEAVEARLRDFLVTNRAVGDSPALQHDLTRLQRQVDRKAQVYINLSAQAELARLETYRDLPALVVLDPATPLYRPVKPQRALIIVVGMFVSFAAGLLFILWRAGMQRYHRQATLDAGADG